MLIAGGFGTPLMRSTTQSMISLHKPGLPSKWRLCSAYDFFKLETKYCIATSMRPQLLRSKCSRFVLYLMNSTRQSKILVFTLLRGAYEQPRFFCFSVGLIGCSSKNMFHESVKLTSCRSSLITLRRSWKAGGRLHCQLTLSSRSRYDLCTYSHSLLNEASLWCTFTSENFLT